MKSYLIMTPPDCDSPTVKLFSCTLGCRCLPVEEGYPGDDGKSLMFIVAAEESADVLPGRISGEEKRRLEGEIDKTLRAAAQVEINPATGWFHIVRDSDTERAFEEAEKLIHQYDIGTKSRSSIFNPLTIGFVERHLPRVLDRLVRLGASVRPAPAGFYKSPIVGVDFFITEDGGALIPFDFEAGAKSAEC